MIEKVKSFFLQRENRNNDYPRMIEDFAGIFVLLLLLVDVTLQVITRYVFNYPLGWTEEAARYLLIIFTFAGAPIAVRNNSNVSLDFLLTNAPAGVKRLFRVISGVIEFVFYVLLTRYSWSMTVFSMKRYLVTVRISRGAVFGLITLSIALMAARCLGRTVSMLRSFNAKQEGR